MANQPILRGGQNSSYQIQKRLTSLRKLAPSNALAAPVNAVAATRVLTMDTQPTAAETITIGTRVYTWVASGAVAGQINRGADLAAAKLNLVAAINGTDSINTAHPQVTAAAFSSNSMTITAKVRGVAANAIATTETMVGGANAWAGATMTGGVDGTPGDAWEERHYSGYIYVNAADIDATITTNNWRRYQLSTY